jgi:hypothetical protein
MSWKRGLLFALVVIPLALATRWGGDAEAKGARFHPWPDTVEYAAEAQALARTGRVFLQIGPHEVRPRFPPGWPLLIAGAVRLGVEGQDLWRISGVFGAALAWLLAMAAAYAAAALGPHHPDPLLPSPPPSLTGRRGRKAGERFGIAGLVSPLPVREGGGEGRGAGGEGSGGPLLAGLLAGCIWAFAPIAAGLGQILMSDEPTALVSLAGLLLAGLAFLGDRRPPLLLALAAGLAFGLAASMRSVAAALMLLPILFFLAGAVRRLGFRAALSRVLAWMAGALVLPVLTAWIVTRSGLHPWEWSGYRFWMPNRFDHWTSTFNLRFALQPDTAFRQAIEGRPLSHLELALRVLLGIPGLRPTTTSASSGRSRDGCPRSPSTGSPGGIVRRSPPGPRRASSSGPWRTSPSSPSTFIPPPASTWPPWRSAWSSSPPSAASSGIAPAGSPSLPPSWSRSSLPGPASSSSASPCQTWTPSAPGPNSPAGWRWGTSNGGGG